MKRAWFVAGALGAALLSANVAFAEGRSRIVIQADAQSRDSGDVASRIAAELDLVGFEVVRITHGGPDIGSFATIVLVTKAGRVEATISIHSAGAPDNAEVHVDASDIEPAGARAAIAIRSVESLRATLFELTRDEKLAQGIPEDVLRWARASETAKAALPASEAPAAPPKPAAKDGSNLVAAHVEPKEFLIAKQPDTIAKPPEPENAPYVERIWLGGGLSVLGSFGTLGLSFGPRVTFDYDLPYGFDIGASFSGQIPAHEVAADAYQLVLMAEASYTLGKRSWVVSPHLNASAGLHIYETTIELQSAPNTVPGKQRGVAFATAPGLGVEFELAPRARMDIDIAALFVVPEPMVDSIGNADGNGGFLDGSREPLIHATADFIFAP